MAKKKTENIKAAPVLRADVGGDQPTPTPEQTGTRTYQIMDPWKDRDKVNLVDVKSVNGEITDVKVNGVPAGGGGGGKEIKVTATGGDTNGECYLTIYLSNAITDIRGLSINEEHNYGLGAQGKIEMFMPDDHYADVLLLKDSVTMDIVTAEGFTYTVTGDATPTTQNSYQVSGNCTVTFTAI